MFYVNTTSEPAGSDNRLWPDNVISLYFPNPTRHKISRKTDKRPNIITSSLHKVNFVLSRTVVAPLRFTFKLLHNTYIKTMRLVHMTT